VRLLSAAGASDAPSSCAVRMVETALVLGASLA
jgi:hypothetical protein